MPGWLFSDSVEPILSATEKSKFKCESSLCWDLGLVSAECPQFPLVMMKAMTALENTVV